MVENDNSILNENVFQNYIINLFKNSQNITNDTLAKKVSFLIDILSSVSKSNGDFLGNDELMNKIFSNISFLEDERILPNIGESLSKKKFENLTFDELGKILIPIFNIIQKKYGVTEKFLNERQLLIDNLFKGEFLEKFKTNDEDEIINLSLMFNDTKIFIDIEKRKLGGLLFKNKIPNKFGKNAGIYFK